MLRSKFQNAAGNRNKLITIQKATNSVSNDANEVLPVFTQTFEPYYAELVTSNAREFLAAMQAVPMLQGIAKVVYDSNTVNISARDRIVIGGRTLNIAGVFNENETNEKIVIWYVEVEA